MIYKNKLTGELCNVRKLKCSEYESWYSCYNFGLIDEQTLRLQFTKIKLTSKLRKV